MSNDDEIIELERRFWQTMIDRDVSTADTLMADTCVITGAQGVSAIDRATFAKLMAGGQWTLHDYSFSDVQVLRPSPDVAIIGYKVSENVTVDGKQTELAAADSSAWIRKDGRWVCVLHTESVLGDPFGRDRKSDA